MYLKHGLVALLALGPVSAAWAVPATDEEAIRQLINAECEAVVQQDVDRLQSMWAPNGVVMDANHTKDNTANTGHVDALVIGQWVFSEKPDDVTRDDFATNKEIGVNHRNHRTKQPEDKESAKHNG